MTCAGHHGTFVLTSASAARKDSNACLGNAVGVTRGICICVDCAFAMHSEFQTKNTTQTAAKNIITAKILAISARLLEIEFRYFKSSACAPCTLLSISSTFESILHAAVQCMTPRIVRLRELIAASSSAGERGRACRRHGAVLVESLPLHHLALL
jgi:hypothetical protein